MAPLKPEKWRDVTRKNREKKRNITEKKLESKPPIGTSPKPVRNGTISIAVAGSILDNAQSPELRTYLAGQIARAACIFQIDEIIIFDDYPVLEAVALPDYCVQFGRILQFLECPQYLRKHFFPIHKDLQYTGILNPLNAPHHFAKNDDCIYREGLVLEQSEKDVQQGKPSIVNIGLKKDVRVNKILTAGLRCTVKLLTEQNSRKKRLKGLVVSPSEPRAQLALYWGYSVRLAKSLSEVFSKAPFKGGYDLTIGTSDKGQCVSTLEHLKYEHCLIVFGGLKGLEFASENDPVFQSADTPLIFNHYLNTLSNQGSRTIRTEEAILISLTALRPILE